MTIKNENTRGASPLDLDRTSVSRPAGDSASSKSASVDQTPGDDSIALSTSNDLVSQALTAGAATRADRIGQLRKLVESNQYHVDAAALSQSIINAHLAGD